MLDIIPYDALRVGVPLSGGPDSAILYYMLMKDNIAESRKARIIPICAPKIDGADYYANLVNQYVCNKLGVEENKILYIGNPWQEHNVIVRNAVVSAFYFGIIECVVLGDNVAPPGGAEFPGMMPIRERVDSPNVFQPFFDMTKDQIIQLYYDEEIEELLTLTHTCTEQNRGHCGQCWQCTERKWAFSQLDRTDPLVS